MGEKKPLISICIPTYNGEKYLQEALDSVKNQTYKNIEVIISDDQSQDRTIEICQQLKEEVDFPVFIYSHKPNGIGANWNHCIEKTNGEYIKFLFQDDILEAECIEKMLHYSIDNNLSIVICKRHIIDSNSNIVVSNPWVDNYGDLQKEAGLEVNEFRIFNKNDINSIHFYRFMYLNIFGEPCASLFKKNIINKIGLFDENMKQMLDYLFYLKTLKFYQIGIIEKKLFSFRIHEEQASEKNQKAGVNDEIHIIKKIFSLFFFNLNYKNKKILIKLLYPRIYKFLYTVKYIK